MKYRTFRNLVVAGVLTSAAVGVVALVKRSETAPSPSAELARALPSAAAEPPPGAPAHNRAIAALAAGADSLRDVDRDALALLARPVGAKIKDATAGKPYKINLYSDDGRRWNRLKVDLDRDQRWDESWTIKPDGAIERRTPADGPASRYRLANGSSWELISSP
jgi:hypothetical protein